MIAPSTLTRSPSHKGILKGEEEGLPEAPPFEASAFEAPTRFEAPAFEAPRFEAPACIRSLFSQCEFTEGYCELTVAFCELTESCCELTVAFCARESLGVHQGLA